MSWNYRTMRSTTPDGTHVFAIHEVYYNEHGAVTYWSLDSIEPMGETFAELVADVKLYQRAFEVPVIAIEADGLYEIGRFGRSKKPKRIWAGNTEATQPFPFGDGRDKEPET